MNLFKFTTTIIIATIFLASCDPNDEPDNIIKDPTDQGVEHYLPNNTGNWWKYNSTDGDQYLREATGTDSIVDGISFKYYTYTKLSNSDANPEYYGLFDGKLYTVFYFSDDGTNPYKAIILTDSPKLGDTWVNTGIVDYGAISVEMRITGKVISVGDNYKMSDTTFSNVIRVENILEAKVVGSGVYNDCGRIIQWFAPEVGIIKHQNDINFPLGLYSKVNLDTLTSYQLVP